MANPWKSLEGFSPLMALPMVWRRWLGTDFEPFQRAFLQKTPTIAESFPCPYDCGCWHRLPLTNNQPPCNTKLLIPATCQCNPPECPDLRLSLEDVTPWELNWSSLASALRKAFGLNPKIAALGLPGTAQIGSWSADAIPVILTIQIDSKIFRAVVAELAARLKRFILLAPTSQHMDANSLELLIHAQAAFFAIDASVTLSAEGSLHALRTSANLFANFTPQPSAEQSLRTIPPPSKPSPRYALRKGLGVWKLIFDGQEADLKQERGTFYVAYLLTNPPEHPIHALDLAAKIPELYRKHLGLTEITDPKTGKGTAVESHARIQERSLSLDDAQTTRAILRKEKELEAILDDENESEPVKAEALRELEAIAEFQRQHSRRTQDSAQRAVRAVRQAIIRFHQRLLMTLDRNGNPHPVLRPFAAHLEKHLLIPSARYCGPVGTRARGPLAGCFTYDPPPGVTWAD
jgi:hypothetical protein